MNNPRVSILMSIFNERLDWISECINSIINQSFPDFELIIINDNPSRDEIDSLIDKFIDDRIVYYKNHKNMGLALSMNKAASLAKGIYFARMDADDICEPDRILLEYNILNTNLYDFVFSNFSFINENSELIKKNNNEYFTPNEVTKIINLRQIINHSTVMFRKDLFEKVGGYRNFICAQDYDLWLRLNENNCRFYMINDTLIKYRVNSSGLSHRLWYTQRLSIFYIFYLSLQRCRTGHDDYSYNHYLNFLNKFHHNSIYYKTRLLKSMDLISKSVLSTNKLTAAYYLFLSLLKSKALRFHFKNYIFKKFYMIKKEIKYI